MTVREGRCGWVPVLELRACLDGAVVAADDLAHARRIVAAAHVLEKKRVEKIGLLLRRYFELFRDTHAQEAAAKSMAGDRVFRGGQARRKVQR